MINVDLTSTLENITKLNNDYNLLTKLISMVDSNDDGITNEEKLAYLLNESNLISNSADNQIIDTSYLYNVIFSAIRAELVETRKYVDDVVKEMIRLLNNKLETEGGK